MTQITISYHKYNDQLAQCEIELPTANVTELQFYFNQFLGQEMMLGTLIQNGEKTTIKFQASKVKIQALEKVIHITKEMTARLN